MKFHNGFTRINKIDGLKKKARKAYHKALRQIGRKLAKILERDI